MQFWDSDFSCKASSEGRLKGVRYPGHLHSVENSLSHQWRWVFEHLKANGIYMVVLQVLLNGGVLRWE